MITIRRSSERGHANHGWLDSHHTFSFSDYHDPRFMGFRKLRVINEDRVIPGAGFPTHPHRDMEIVSYVLEGGLAHKDSMGSGSVIRPGDVQAMSAGTGVTHSEFNASKDEPVHFLQIWIQTAQPGAQPRYEEKRFSPEEKRGKLRLIVSPDGEAGSVRILQDVRVYATVLATGQSVEQPLASGRHGWVQVARGSVQLNGETLGQGDGAAITEERLLRLTGVEDAEVLVFDLD